MSAYFTNYIYDPSRSNKFSSCALNFQVCVYCFLEGSKTSLICTGKSKMNMKKSKEEYNI